MNNMPYYDSNYDRKSRYTKAEAIAMAAFYRSGHSSGSPESRIDAYYDYDAKLANSRSAMRTSILG